MKTVLVITNSFPPGGGSGMLRTMKFAQYLPLYGWRPIVLSVKEEYNDKKDYSVLKNIPPLVKVYRTSIVDPLGLFNAKNKKPDKGSKKYESAKDFPESHIKKIVKKVRRGFLAMFSTPDKFIGWFFPAVIKGLDIINKEKINIIYATSPTATAALIGLALKKTTGIRFIVDFRDPWTLDRANNPLIGKIRLKVENWMEKQVFRCADTVIVNTDYLKRLYEERFTFKKEKIITLPNGYDSEDFEALSEESTELNNSKLTISHVGEFYENDREPVEFLKALSGLIKDGKVKKENLLVNLVGGGEYVNTDKFRNLIEDLNLDTIVRLLPRIPHRESIQFMVQSHILLLLQPTPRYKAQIPAKAFEYLKTGRFIFAIAPDGATADLIKHFKAGEVIDEQDTAGLRRLIFELYCKFMLNQLNQSFTKENLLSKFERKSLTRDLSVIFDAMFKKHL